VLDGESLMKKSLMSRYGVKQQFILLLFPCCLIHKSITTTAIKRVYPSTTKNPLRPVSESETANALRVASYVLFWRQSLADSLFRRFKIKTMELAYGIAKVLQEDVPRLTHGNDGLIFTCAESGYTPGTDERMWVFYLCRFDGARLR